MSRFICFPDDINWLKRNLGHFGRKMIKLKIFFITVLFEIYTWVGVGKFREEGVPTAC